MNTIKKIVFLLYFLIIANVLCTAQEVTISEEWEYSERKGNTPSFVSNPTYGARGMGVGFFNGSRVIVVPALTPSIAIHILNAENGSEIGTLIMSNVVGGTVPVSDAAVTTDGYILASNLITKGGDTFKVYQWDKLSDQSKVAISYPLPDKTGRYGDHITVTGSISDGTAKVFAASEISDGKAYKVLCFSMTEDLYNPGKYSFDQAPKVTSAAIKISSYPRPLRPSVSVLDNDNLIHKGKGSQLIELKKDGVPTGKLINKTVIPDNSLSPQYITTSNEYLLIGIYNDELKCGTVVSIKDNDWDNASVVLNTPTLGQKENANGTGRFIINVENEVIYLYVLGTNNGIGKYKITH